MQRFLLITILSLCSFITTSAADMYSGYGSSENHILVEQAYSLKGQNKLIDGMLSLREEIRNMNKSDIDFLLKLVRKKPVDTRKVIERIEQDQKHIDAYNAMLIVNEKSLRSDNNSKSLISSISRFASYATPKTLPHNVTISAANTANVPITHAAKFMLNIPGGVLQQGYLPFTPVSSQVAVAKYALLASYITAHGYKNIGQVLKKHPTFLKELSLFYPIPIAQNMLNADIKTTMLYDENGGKPVFWVPNAGFILHGTPVIGKMPIPEESDLSSEVGRYKIRGLGMASPLAILLKTRGHIRSQGTYLAYQDAFGKLRPTEKKEFEEWKKSPSASFLEGFSFVKQNDLQPGDVVVWKNVEGSATTGSGSMFVAWIDKHAKNPIFLTIDVNQYDTFLDGVSIRPVTINKLNRIACFIRKQDTSL